ALSLSRAALSDLNLEEFRTRISTEVPDTGMVRIRGVSAPRCRMSFVAQDLVQAGFTCFRIAEDTAINGSETEEAIANEFYRIRSASDGLDIVDLRHNVTLRLGFEDEGDRGDEYNFDPVPGAQPITHPVACSVQKIENGPVRSRAVVAMIYDVP